MLSIPVDYFIRMMQSVACFRSKIENLNSFLHVSVAAATFSVFLICPYFVRDAENAVFFCLYPRYNPTVVLGKQIFS